MNRAILCIFAKPPVPGKVKTRLIPYLSAREAADMAGAFLEDVASTCRKIPDTQTVIATLGDWPSDIPSPKDLEIWQQQGKDLGKRMESIFIRGLQQAPIILALGADAPLISIGILEDALGKLKENDALIGPSEDGGYYLLGFTRLQAGLLDNLPWSQPHTRQATEQRLTARGYTFAQTSMLFDIDTPEDLKRLRKEACFEATRQALSRLKAHS
jgi:rSAM/selenodomain-associated transferase 1